MRQHIHHHGAIYAILAVAAFLLWLALHDDPWDTYNNGESAKTNAENGCLIARLDDPPKSVCRNAAVAYCDDTIGAEIARVRRDDERPISKELEEDTDLCDKVTNVMIEFLYE